MIDLTNLTNEQLRRMVELLHESGLRLLVAYDILSKGAHIDSWVPLREGIDLRTDAERIRHEPRETDPAAKALADRKTVEEWAKATENARCVWYCDKCGTPEPAGPEYKHGDCEPCCLCEDGTARVMTRHEAMARGGKP